MTHPWKGGPMLEGCRPCHLPIHPAAGWFRVCARGGEPLRPALHEPPGCPHQTLAATTALAVLPLSATWRRYHHVSFLLPGTGFQVPLGKLYGAGGGGNLTVLGGQGGALELPLGPLHNTTAQGRHCIGGPGRSPRTLGWPC